MTAETQVQILNDADYKRHSLPESLGSFGNLQTSQGHLPLTDMHIEGKIVGLVYRLQLRQRFFNANSQPLEATYIFPLLARAAVGSFVMQTQERRVVGVLEERAKARAQYQQAIAAGKQAAIAEEERAEVFTMKVGNIPPQQFVDIEIELDGPLNWADGQAVFRFPLVVAPRYIPGTAYSGPAAGHGTAQDTDAVPDASTISPPILLPGYPNPVRLQLEVDIDLGGLRVSALAVSLSEIDCRPSAGGFQLRLNPATGCLNRDLIVRMDLAQSEVQSSLMVYSQTPEDHYFLLNLVPAAESVSTPAAARQVVALLDRSGSMEGWKMVCARRAVARIMDSLTDVDHFEVLNFDDRVEPLVPTRAGLKVAEDRIRFESMAELSKVEARGGTEILRALEAGVKLLKGSENPCLLLFTDGQVGNEAELLNWVQTNANGIRIFTVGIDEAVNASLLERLAQVSGGHCTLVDSENALDKAMEGMQQRINPPQLEHIRVLKALEQAPARANVFARQGTRVLGRYQGHLPAELVVDGTLASGDIWRESLPVIAVSNDGIRKIWARERLLELEHGFLAGWIKPAYQPAAITAFSLQHQVLCRFTAFVAIDDESYVEGPLKQVTQAVDTPSGWEMEKQAAPGGLMRRSVSQGKPMLGGVSKASAPLKKEAHIQRSLSRPSPAPAPEPEYAAFDGASDPFGSAADPFASAPAADPFAAHPAADPFSAPADPFAGGAEFDLLTDYSPAADPFAFSEACYEPAPALEDILSPAPPPPPAPMMAPIFEAARFESKVADAEDREGEVESSDPETEALWKLLSETLQKHQLSRLETLGLVQLLEQLLQRSQDLNVMVWLQRELNVLRASQTELNRSDLESLADRLREIGRF